MRIEKKIIFIGIPFIIRKKMVYLKKLHTTVMPFALGG